MGFLCLLVNIETTTHSKTVDGKTNFTELRDATKLIFIVHIE